jgi:hypothetical protein
MQYRVFFWMRSEKPIKPQKNKISHFLDTAVSAPFYACLQVLWSRAPIKTSPAVSTHQTT